MVHHGEDLANYYRREIEFWQRWMLRRSRAAAADAAAKAEIGKGGSATGQDRNEEGAFHVLMALSIR